MNLTAKTEAKAQELASFRSVDPSNSNYYQIVRLVAWISQNVAEKKTTIYFRWKIEQYNYYPYDNDAHTYSVKIGTASRAYSFSIPQKKQNGVRIMTTPQSITVSHNSSTGAYTGTVNVSAYKCWQAVSASVSVTLPTIASQPDPQYPEPDPPTPIELDNDPRYYIYADSKLIYSAGVKELTVLHPKLVLEVNKAGSLKFELPVGSAGYGSIDKLKTTVEARQGNEVLFRGRLLNTQRTLLNTVSCYCEGWLSWLNDIVFLPYTFDGQGRDLLKDFITRYNSRASTNRQITYVYSDISSKISVNREEHSTALNEIKKMLIDNIGGYLVPYLTESVTGIQWLSDYGSTSSQVIQFTKNLLDFNEYIDASQVFTAVRPLGKMVDGSRIGLTGGSSFITDDSAVNVFGRIEKTVIFNEIDTQAALRQAGEAYLRTGIQSAISMTIKAVDLHMLDVNVERIRLGDFVRIVSVPHEIDAYFMCTKIEIDMANPQNTLYTFGSTQRTISELTDATRYKYVINTSVVD